MDLIEEFGNERFTSLVYMNTSVIPHKVVGHVLAEKLVDKYNAVEFDLGKF